MDFGVKPTWSKATPIRPRDYFVITSPKEPKFIASYERNPCVAMSWLLGMEYARIWFCEHNQFLNRRKEKAKPKFIKNDYHRWIEKRRPHGRCICPC